MKRLLQALSNKIYAGDLVRNKKSHKLLLHKTFVVDEVRTNGLGDIFVVYHDSERKDVCITIMADAARKMKAQIFWEAWNVLIGRQKPVVKKPDTLQQKCKEHNISYLYNEMMSSKTVEQFNLNMTMISRILNK